MLLTKEKKNQIKVCTGAANCETIQKFIDEFQTVGIELREKDYRISELESEVKELRIYSLNLEQENKLLKEELGKEKANVNLLRKFLYGSGNKKVEIVDVMDESEEVEYEKTSGGYVVKNTKRGAKEGHKGHGRKIPDNLPVEKEFIDLAEDEKHCEICGMPFIETGMEEVSSEISVKKFYYVRKIIRKKYKRSCNCGSKIITAPLPKKLIPKGKFSIEFWVECLVNKFLKHLPVERQKLEMKMYGIDVSSGTIISGFKRIYLHFIEPLYQSMLQELRKSSHWYADETGWHVYIVIKDKNNYNWFMWVYISKNIILYVLDPSRSSKVPYKVLFNMDEEDIKKLSNSKLFESNDSEISKILNADKYIAYKALQNQGLLLIAYCWSHQRREFTDLLTKYPEDEELKIWVKMWVEKIAELFKVNEERIKYKKGTPAFVQHHQKLKTIIDWMKEEIEKEYQHPVKIEIMSSAKAHWSGLTLFVEYPEIPPHNNLSERMLRPVVLGRNNYYGDRSIWGGDLASAIYSIIQTCLLHGISPVAYLIFYFQECAKRGSAPDENEIASFLPHNLLEEIKKKLCCTNRPEPATEFG